MQENRDNDIRRNEFVDAAEKLFRQNGIVDTTISSIVKEMDVAKGLFYYYFKSKDDVIEAISEKYNEVFNEMMNDSMDGRDYDARLRQFINNSIRSFRELNCKLKGDAEDVDLTELSLRSMVDARRAATMKLQRLLDEGNRTGSLNMEAPNYCACLIISGIIELIRQEEATDADIQRLIMNLIEKTGKEN